MLAVARKMLIKRHGTDPSMPPAQMNGSALGTLFRNNLAKPVPIHTPRMPETTVMAPKIKLYWEQRKTAIFKRCSY